MSIAFVVIFLVAFELKWCTLKLYKSFNIEPSDYIVILLFVNSALFFVPCVWYFGWVGLISPVIGFFDIFHYIIGWVAMLPFLSFNDKKAYYALVFCTRAVIPTTCIIVGFTVASFFLADYKCLSKFLMKDGVIPIVLLLAVIGYISFLAVKRRLAEREAFERGVDDYMHMMQLQRTMREADRAILAKYGPAKRREDDE